MLNYLPEKLYDAIDKSKYKSEYDDIVTIIECFREGCKNLTESLNLENEDYIKSNKDLLEARTNLDKIVHDHFKEYALPYDIQMGKYTRDELVKLYNGMKDDTTGFVDVKAICLDEIVDNSYDDGSYINLMRDYIKEYEKTPFDAKIKLSTFTHMKYMRAAIFIAIEEYKETPPENWLMACDKMISIYNDTKKFTGENDSITHQFVECMCDFLNAVADSKDLIRYIQYIYDFCFHRLQFQYQDYSYGKANMLMIISKLAVAKGDFTTFINATQELCQYLNNALRDIPNLIAGLTFYDKTNVTMFFSIIRWILMLNLKIPVIKDNKVCSLNNLSITDYNTAFADMEEINDTLPNNKTDICSNEFSKSIDAWFDEKNGAYTILASM